MKHLFNFFLFFCLALTFTACSNTESEVKPTDHTETTETPVIRASYQTDAPAPVKMMTSSLGVHQLVSYATDAPGILVTETIEPAPESTGGLGDWFKTNWGEAMAALLAIYEILARLIPTMRTNSIITIIVAILNYIVPDRAKNGGRFVDPNTVK